MLFRERGIRVAAASADSLECAREVAEGMGLSFPVAWGLDAGQVQALTGAWIDTKHRIVQPSAFLLRPGGEVAVAVYSSWAVGRLRPEEIFGAIHYLELRRA